MLDHTCFSQHSFCLVCSVSQRIPEQHTFFWQPFYMAGSTAERWVNCRTKWSLKHAPQLGLNRHYLSSSRCLPTAVKCATEILLGNTSSSAYAVNSSYYVDVEGKGKLTMLFPQGSVYEQLQNQMYDGSDMLQQLQTSLWTESPDVTCKYMEIIL